MFINRPPPAHAQIGHFRAPISLDIGWVSVLLKVNFFKQEHTTLIPEQTELDHDSLGLFTQLKDNIAQTVHVYSIALLFSVGKSGWRL